MASFVGGMLVGFIIGFVLMAFLAASSHQERRYEQDQALIHRSRDMRFSTWLRKSE